MRGFLEKLTQRASDSGSLLCIGLDPDFALATQRFPDDPSPLFAYSRWLIDQTHPFACAFKPNSAFFEAQGHQGMLALEQTCTYLMQRHPSIPLILDAKRGDIGHTNAGYVQWAFDILHADAITLHPYLGSEALEPFLARIEKGSIILCRTSNPGAAEIQDYAQSGVPLWEHVALQVSQEWNANQNCMLVVGATYPRELSRIREIAPEIWLLVPGIGAQGGDLEAVLKVGVRGDGSGLLVSVSRTIASATSPAQAARELRDAINAIRRQLSYGTISSS